MRPLTNHSLSVDIVVDSWRLLLLLVCTLPDCKESERVCLCRTKASEDVCHGLVHGHVYETSAQAVMGEEEQHGL